MGRAAEIFTNRWWRYDEYEVADGYLRPKQGAKLGEYEPWAAYASCVERNTEARPYMELIDLAERISANPAERTWWGVGTLGEASRDALCSWAASNGLLGLALQRTEQVEPAPRWAPLPTGISVVVSGVEQKVAKTRVRYARTPGGWTRFTGHDEGRGSLSADDSLVGQLVLPDEVPTSWSPGSALVRDKRYALVSEPIERTWAQYFPDVAREAEHSHDYPFPLGEGFWASYGEPVSELLGVAARLGAAAREAARLEGMSDAEVESLDEDSSRRLFDAVESLQLLVAPSTPRLNRASDRSLRLRWTGPSLLSLFAMMILLDLTSRMKLHACEECHGLFLSPSPAATYCSDPCRWRYQKRVQRKRGSDRAGVAGSPEDK